jgi:hypothetical protein
MITLLAILVVVLPAVALVAFVFDTVQSAAGPETSGYEGPDV